MQLNAYLSFKGDCSEAFAFYERALGAETLMTMPYGGSPMADQAPEGWADKIMHGRIRIGDQIVMGSDAPPGRYTTPAGMQLSLETPDEHEADRIFAALAEGGAVGMPIQETFWAKRFGMVTDRFGVPWMVDCQKPG